METIISYRINLALEKFDCKSRSTETTVGHAALQAEGENEYHMYQLYQSIQLDKLEKILYMTHNVTLQCVLETIFKKEMQQYVPLLLLMA
jgi:hypothetical protein